MKQFGSPEEETGAFFFPINIIAKPKSAMNGFPEEDIKIFSGLRSAWTKPFSLSVRSPLSIPVNIYAICKSVRLLLFCSMKRFKFAAEQYSEMKNG